MIDFNSVLMQGQWFKFDRTLKQKRLLYAHPYPLPHQFQLDNFKVLLS